MHFSSRAVALTGFSVLCSNSVNSTLQVFHIVYWKHKKCSLNGIFSNGRNSTYPWKSPSGGFIKATWINYSLPQDYSATIQTGPSRKEMTKLLSQRNSEAAYWIEYTMNIWAKINIIEYWFMQHVWVYFQLCFPSSSNVFDVVVVVVLFFWSFKFMWFESEPARMQTMASVNFTYQLNELLNYLLQKKVLKVTTMIVKFQLLICFCAWIMVFGFNIVPIPIFLLVNYPSVFSCSVFCSD